MQRKAMGVGLGLLGCALAANLSIGARYAPGHGNNGHAHAAAVPAAATVDVGEVSDPDARFVTTVDREDGDAGSGRRDVFARITNTGRVTSRAACVISEVDATGTTLWASSIESPPIAPGTVWRIVGVDPELHDPPGVDRYRVSCSPLA